MTAKVISSAINGFEATPITVECDSSNSLPTIVIVGMAGKSVDEAKERLRSAISNSKMVVPSKRLILNLSPADLPKSGTSFDLAMALAILVRSEQVNFKKLAKTTVVGELGLDGELKPIPGILAHIKAARDSGQKAIFIPKSNQDQAQLLNGIEIYCFENLSQVIEYLLGSKKLEPIENLQPKIAQMMSIDLSEIRGQAQAKRAIIIAAAGAHNILLSGSPGGGKTMLAQALQSILPPLNQEQMIDSTLLHSLHGNKMKHPITSAPFRSPHHSASHVSIVGGGTKSKPGEISLAHNGVLFLDEIPEFSRATLESLRQPLEDGIVTVARANNTSVYPANFMLVGTNNPCPCGYLGDRRAACFCSMNQVINYQKRISGPLYDRIDMVVQLPRVKLEKFWLKPKKKLHQ